MQKEIRRVDTEQSCITETALRLRSAEDYTCRTTDIHYQK